MEHKKSPFVRKVNRADGDSGDNYGKLGGQDKASIVSGFFGGFGGILSGASELVQSITGKYKPAPVTNVYVDEKSGGGIGNMTPYLLGGGLLLVVLIVALIARR